MKTITLAGGKTIPHPDEVPEESRDEYLRTLAELNVLYEDNPLERYFPHAKQEVFHGARTRVKAFLGGNRSGKTTAGIADDLIQAVDLDCLPQRLRPFKRWTPPFKCRIVAPDFTSTMEGVIFEKLREWAPRHQLLGGEWDEAYDKTRRLLRFRNGSVFSFMTFEQDLDKFGGWSGHRVHYDEEPPKDIRTECARGLVDLRGDELFTMTPLHGMTWMYDDIYERQHEDEVTVVEVATDDNPHLDVRAMEEFFAGLTEEEREARRKGRFVHFGGLVLAKFDESRHVVDEVHPDHLQGLTVFVGIDPGIVRGGVVWAAFDRDNSMLVFDELYPKNLTVPGYAKAIRERNEHWGLVGDRKPLYVIDPSSRNRQLTDSESVEAQFYAEGVYAIRGQNSRRAGVFQLRRRVEASPPLLLVTRNCRNWLWERARWRVDEDEESSQEVPRRTDNSGDSFATVGPDHLMDPTRYIALERYVGPVVEKREVERVWTPGTAPPQGWFTGAKEEAPLGFMS